MDRMHIQCEIDGQLTNLQLDKKSMPGEAGPCFMVTAKDCFKGYIARQRNGSYLSIGDCPFIAQDLDAIGEALASFPKSGSIP